MISSSTIGIAGWWIQTQEESRRNIEEESRRKIEKERRRNFLKQQERVPVKIGNKQGDLGGVVVSLGEHGSVELSEDGEEVPHLGRGAGEEDPAAGVHAEYGSGGEPGEKLCQQLSLLWRHLHQHVYVDGQHLDIADMR